MFNIYTYLKKEKEEDEIKKLKIIKSNNLKTEKIKREKLSKNYEERIKNFIYKLSDNNIYSDISLKNKEPFIRLLNNEKEKEKNKLIQIKENKKYDLIFNNKELITPEKKENILEKKFKLKKNKILDNNEITKNNFSINTEIKDKKLSATHKNKNIINQPILRYKSRNDLERIFEEIKDLKFENDNFYNCLEKNLFNLQKKKILKGKKHLNNNDNDNDNYNNKRNKYNYKKNKKDIDENRNMDCLELIVDKKNNKEKDFKIFFNYSRNKKLIEKEDNKLDNLSENKNIKKTNYDFDIIKTKNNIHKNLDIKTYFNGIKNYSLWKDSCFIKQNISDNNSKLKISLSSKDFYHKTNNYRANKKRFTPRNEKKYKNKNEIIPLIYILNNPQNIDLLKYKKIIIDTNNNNINIKKKFNINKNTLNDELILNQIKQIAFNKNFIDIPGKKSPRIFKRRKTIKNNLYEDVENTEDLILKKDLSSLCNKIMKKYGQINEKYNENLTSYSK